MAAVGSLRPDAGSSAPERSGTTLPGVVGSSWIETGPRHGGSPVFPDPPAAATSGAGPLTIGGMSEGEETGSGAEPVISAGGVVLVRRTGAGARIAVMESGGLASLPRAEVGPGESAETAARRAARVFLGGSPRLHRTLGETREATDGGQVLTWFWLASPRGGLRSGTSSEAAPPQGFHLHWMEVEEARLSLESEDEAELLAHLGARDLRTPPSPLASGERRELRAALSLTREQALPRHGASVGVVHPEATDPSGGAAVTDLSSEVSEEDLDAALEAAQFELHRAEERLERGDLEGARRAQVRAARAGLFALDGPGRRVEFARLWRSLSAPTRQDLGLDGFTPGWTPGLCDLLTLHDAAEAQREERHRERATSIGHQVRASLALLASVTAFSWLAAAAPLAVEHGLDTPAMYALHLSLLGALGGWSGGALRRVRSVRGHPAPPRPALTPPFEAALGAGAGLAAGLALSAGFTTPPAGGHLAFVAATTYAAGWFGFSLLQRR